VEATDPLQLFTTHHQKLEHKLPLASAYAALRDAPGGDPRVARQKARLDTRTGEPLFTNHTRDFKVWSGC
jgi:hypothetical protein